VTTTPAAFPADPAGVVLLSLAAWAVVAVPVFLRYRSRTRHTPPPAAPPHPAHPQPVSERGAYDPGAFTISPERNPS
jgi:hypothetical protein